MSFATFAQSKDQLKIVQKALKDSEAFVSRIAGDLSDFSNDQICAIANVSESTRKRDYGDYLQHVIDVRISEEKHRQRLSYWNRDAVIIYRAFRLVIERFDDRNRKKHVLKYLPLIVKTYDKHRKSA